jgi:hypothetical protein
VARGGGNRGNAGNRGNSGRTYGRPFRVFGRKRHKPGRPRKVPRALTSAFIGPRPESPQAPAPEPVSESADDIEDLRVERRTEESEIK